VHGAEGCDAGARREIGELDEIGALDSRTAVVHGVGIGPRALDVMRRRGAALIWCPTSNLRMLGRTVSRTVLRSDVPIALATDSALSAPVDLLDELRIARRFLPAARLYEMVSSAPARILRLAASSTRGDWVAFNTAARTPQAALFEGTVALVKVAGRIRLISPELARQLPAAERRRFQLLHLEGRAPVLVDAAVGALRRAASKHLGDCLHLAAKRILP